MTSAAPSSSPAQTQTDFVLHRFFDKLQRPQARPPVCLGPFFRAWASIPVGPPEGGFPPLRRFSGLPPRLLPGGGRPDSPALDAKNHAPLAPDRIV